VSDARIRELEREAMAGDRAAMLRLLIEERRLGALHPGLACIERGTHRWAAVTASVRAVGTRVAWSVCIDCWAADAVKRERSLDAPCPDLVNVTDHVARELLHSDGTGRLHVRTLCGHVHMVWPEDAPEHWANATTRATCGSCVRARPERVEAARKAASEIHEALRALAAAFVPGEAHTVEAPLDQRSPVWGADGTLILARGGAMGLAYSHTHMLRVEGEPEREAPDTWDADWGES
jgi:hypothetical protein